jgi:hypothetical protein
MCDDCEDDDTIHPVRLRAVDLLVVLTQVVGGIAESVMDGCTSLENMFAGHANWVRDQADFASEARHAIEHIDDLKE